ncbi:MAG: LysM peptidoglycan-binding domain-containing protein [Myxococcaceae bacterium]|nr:LysM peptidoglycan-binding domain-containing protein [Myxococcaceae bacterium]
MASYTVQPGDTLPGIAKTFLGDPGRWRELQLYNQALLVDPARLCAGMVLRLPPGAAVPTPTTRPGASTAGAGSSDGRRTRRLRAVARSGKRPPFSRR